MCMKTFEIILINEYNCIGAEFLLHGLMNAEKVKNFTPIMKEINISYSYFSYVLKHFNNILITISVFTCAYFYLKLNNLNSCLFVYSPFFYT